MILRLLPYPEISEYFQQNRKRLMQRTFRRNFFRSGFSADSLFYCFLLCSVCTFIHHKAVLLLKFHRCAVGHDLGGSLGYCCRRKSGTDNRVCSHGLGITYHSLHSQISGRVHHLIVGCKLSSHNGLKAVHDVLSQMYRLDRIPLYQSQSLIFLSLYCFRCCNKYIFLLLSISYSSGFLCFFLYFTHSVSRYSICPFMERKSSSAHWAISFQRETDSLRGTCFFAFSFPLLLFSCSRMCHHLIFNTGCRCLQ